MRKNSVYFSSPYWHWLWSERYQISVTLFAALLPVIANLISWISNWKNVGSHRISDVLLVSDNSLFQAIFIFVTLFVLIYNMRKTKECLTKNKELIANYIERNTNRHIRHCKEKYAAFEIVSIISNQFYWAWILVWSFWLIYYVGKTIFMASNNDEASFWTFGQVFDFLSTAAMYGIYLILNTATTKFESRAQKNYGLWNGAILLLLLFAIWISLITFVNPCGQTHQYSELFVSAFSTISFVLVLGKLNSNYLQIPPLFLFIMYLYAIFQAYVPFRSDFIIRLEDKNLTVFSCKVIGIVVPYATIIGKLFVMLTLCWIVDKKRLIFFIIHKSAALEETPVLLDKLDSEPVEF